MPVPRRFDRRPPERDTTRINERIRVPEVRLIDDTGAQVGVMKTDQAVRFAQERDLDLVEVAPNARPPVCRVLDYSKYKYEQAQKQKSARKHQQQITIREIKFRPKIAEHDYETKKGHVERFLRHKDKVKITIMFRGREVTHPERGVMILDRLAEDLGELSQIEQRPIQDGRNMTMVLGPSKAVLADAVEEGDELPLDDADLDATHGEGEGEDASLTLEGAAEVAETDGSAAEDQPLGDVTAVAGEGVGEPGDAEAPAEAPEPAIAEAAAAPQTTATKPPAPKKARKPKGGRRSRDPEPQAEIEGDFTGLGALPPPPEPTAEEKAAAKAYEEQRAAAEAVKAQEAEAAAAKVAAAKAEAAAAKQAVIDADKAEAAKVRAAKAEAARTARAEAAESGDAAPGDAVGPKIRSSPKPKAEAAKPKAEAAKPKADKAPAEADPAPAEADAAPAESSS